jgi:hypothetical protein
VVDSKDVVFYLSMIFLCLFVDRDRWNRCGGGHNMAAKWIKARQTKYWSYAGLHLVILAVLAAVNFLANRYDKSYDSTANKQFSLSDQTIKWSRT